MNFDTIIEELKKYSTDNRTNEPKEIYLFEEFDFKDYEIGVIINEYNNNVFEVYLYMKGNKKSISKLLLKEFDDLNSAKEYYVELNKIAKQGNLANIKEKIIQ